MRDWLAGLQIADEREQPLAEVAGLARVDLAADAAQRALEALAVERLEQVVERLHLERAQRVLVVGGDEHDGRHPIRADGLDHLEAVELRHLDVEEHEIRGLGQDGLDGFDAVPGFADDLDVLFSAEERAHPLARERLVVDDQRTDRARGRRGRRRRG